MKLSGHTKPYAVLGHPIGHTLSPVMHNASFRKLELDAIYLAFDVDPAELMTVLPAMGTMGFGGVNLTVPLKEVAFKGLDNLGRSAQLLGSVNTIEFTPEGLKGHSTDGKGFLLAMDEAFSASPANLGVFVLGCGGAGRAVAITCATEGAGQIVLSDVDDTRARKLAQEISGIAPATSTSVVPPDKSDWTDAAKAADLVIQATPVGMKKDEPSILDPDAFREGQLVFDLIYMYPETAFMRAATEAGARTANGLGMLLHQGAFSFTIWTGQKPDVGAMRNALEADVYGDK